MGIAGLDTPEKIDAVITDPILRQTLKAELNPLAPVGAPTAIGNPLVSPGAPVPPVDNVSMVLGPKATPPPAPAPVDPGPLAVFPHLAPKPQPAGPPPGPPSPANAAPIGPAPKAGSVVLGPAAAPKPIDKNNYGKFDAQVAQEKEALAHEGVMGSLQLDASKIEAERAAAAEAQLTNQAIALDKRERLLAARAQERKQFLNDYNHATEAAVEDYQKSKVDPSRFWADKTAPEKFVTMIGVALSGLAQGMRAGAGLNPGENTAMQMIDQFIARDIDAQKANIAKKGAGIEARNGLFARYLAQFGNEDQAEITAYQAYLTKARADVDAWAAKSNIKEVKVRADVLKESIDNRIATLKNANDLVGQSTYANHVAQMQKAAAAAQAEVKARNKAIFDANLKAKTEQITKNGGWVAPAETDIEIAPGIVVPKGMPVAYNTKGVDTAGTESLTKIETVNIPVVQPGGGVAYTAVPVTKGTHSEAAKKAAGAASAIKALEAMEQAAAMPGTWTGEKKKLYEQAVSNYTTSYGVAQGMGALSADDRKIINETIPGVPTYGIGYLSDAQKKQLANQKKQLADNAAAAITSFGPAETAGPAPITSAGPAK